MEKHTDVTESAERTNRDQTKNSWRQACPFSRVYSCVWIFVYAVATFLSVVSLAVFGVKNAELKSAFGINFCITLFAVYNQT